MSIGYDEGDFKLSSRYDFTRHEWYPAKYGTYEAWEEETRRERQDTIRAEMFQKELRIRNARRLGMTEEEFDSLDVFQQDELLIRWNAKRLGFTDAEVDEMSDQRKRYLLP